MAEADLPGDVRNSQRAALEEQLRAGDALAEDFRADGTSETCREKAVDLEAGEVERVGELV